MRYVLLCVLLLTGCNEVKVIKEPVEVRVPYPVIATPPDVLLEPLDNKPPEFVSPDDPRATSALTPAGETKLKLFLNELRARLDGWRAWANER